MGGSPDAGLTEDGFLGGAVRLRQPARGYRAGLDAVLLAASVPARPRDRVLDAGAGHGATAILLARRAGCDVTGLERDPGLAGLARGNARRNGLAGRVRFVAGDVLRPPPAIPAAAFDHAIANPPHLDPARAAAPPGAGAGARMEGAARLGDWIGFLLRAARPGGTLTLVHRADRLDEILAALSGRAGGIVVFPLWPRPGAAARRVLVRARKGVRTPTALAAGLVLHGADGAVAPAADAVLRGAALGVDSVRDRV